MKLVLAILLFLLVAVIHSPSDNSRSHARSMVITRFGIVATSQSLASAAGASILEQGGNAVDAAIAANAVLGVVDPGSNGIGGDLFAMVYESQSGKLYGLNASGWAPRNLSINWLENRGIHSMPQTGIHSVTVPGCVAGWEALRRKLGRLDLPKILAPAIYYAKNGIPITEFISRDWEQAAGFLAGQPNTKETYLPNGRSPAVGELFRNPDLASSLQRIAEKGRDGFYRGPTAEAILDVSHENDGTLALSDLTDFEPEWVDPISTTYRGWKVYELPPNGQGVAVLIMLNLMEQFPLKDYGSHSAQALHIMIEAKKLAYADMLNYVGDPRFSKVPVAAMISKDLAEKRAHQIQPERANCQVPPSDLSSITHAYGGDTVYLSTIDQEGNIVSLIQSNYNGFGSGLVARHTGFALQNRGALFTLDRGRPNSLEPRKRPLHTIIPALMEKDGIRIGFGIMGGWNQAQAHAQFVSNVADFGMNVQEALETARFSKPTFGGCDVLMESRVPEKVRATLIQWGHDIRLLGPFSEGVGGGQAVMRDHQGRNYGGSDPRKDGEAIPQNPSWNQP
ncbi:MAG: gamma-glutamyltransferase [Terriglobia bacterium]